MRSLIRARLVIATLLLATAWSLPLPAQEKTSALMTPELLEKVRTSNNACFACHTEDGVKNPPKTESGMDLVKQLMHDAASVGDVRAVAGMVPVSDVKALQALGDALREQMGSGVAALGASHEDGKGTLLVVVTDDLRERGVRADAIVRALATVAGGRGGGKAHMAQAGIPDASRIPAALEALRDVVSGALAG